MGGGCGNGRIGATTGPVASTRIQQRLLIAFLGVVVAVLLPAAFMLDSWIGDGVRDLVREPLTREAEAMAGELQRAQPADLADWVAHSATTARVTVIDGDGRVRGDSDVASNALASVENHATRPDRKSVV